MQSNNNETLEQTPAIITRIFQQQEESHSSDSLTIFAPSNSEPHRHFIDNDYLLDTIHKYVKLNGLSILKTDIQTLIDLKMSHLMGNSDFTVARILCKKFTFLSNLSNKLPKTHYSRRLCDTKFNRLVRNFIFSIYGADASSEIYKTALSPKRGTPYFVFHSGHCPRSSFLESPLIHSLFINDRNTRIFLTTFILEKFSLNSKGIASFFITLYEFRYVDVDEANYQSIGSFLSWLTYISYSSMCKGDYSFMTDFYYESALTVRPTSGIIRIFLDHFLMIRFQQFTQCGPTLLGAFQFLLSGGESNPGPIMSTLRNTIGASANFVTGGFFQKIQETGEFLSETANLGVLTLHCMRMFSTVSDFIEAILYKTIASPLNFYTRLVSLVLSAYESHNTIFKDLGIRFTRRGIAQSGSFETFLVGGLLSQMLPTQLKQIFREIPLFTTTKLLDDTTWVYDILGFIVSLPRKVLQTFTILGIDHSIIDAFIQILLDFEDNFPFSKMGSLHQNMRKILLEYHKTPKLMCEPTFQTEVLNFHKKFAKAEECVLATRRVLPLYMHDSVKQFKELVKSIHHARETRRVEPVFICFVGPPKTGKSVALSNLVDSYSKDHGVYYDPMPKGDKVFYDTYQNQTIHVLDDLGQASNSQWAPIIPMVSSVQKKLDCAAAELKDTKFYNSTLILASANHIPNNFGPKDGIVDKEALYRRIHRWDTHQLTFDNGKYYGYISVERYNDTPGIKRWVQNRRFKVSNNKLPMDLIDEYIRKEMAEKINHFNQWKDVENRFEPLPQARPQSILATLIELLPGADYLCDYLYDKCAILLDAYNELPADQKYKVKVLTFIATTLSLAGVYGVYSILTKDDTPQPVKERQLLYTSEKKQKKSIRQALPQGLAQLLELDIVPVNIPQLSKFQDNVHYIKIVYRSKDGDTRDAYQTGMFSGYHFLTTLHSLYDADFKQPMFVTAYFTDGSCFYDTMLISMKEKNVPEDWIIFSLPRTAPVYKKTIKLATNPTNKNTYLATPVGVHDLTHTLHGVDFETDYMDFVTGYKGIIKPNSHILTPIQENGLCGSWLLTGDGGLIGHHVAAVDIDFEDETTQQGVCRYFSCTSLDIISKYFRAQDVPLIVIKKELADSSVAFVDNKDVKVYPNTDVTIAPSLVSGIYPDLRAPAQPLEEGKHTMKTQMIKSFHETPTVDQQGLDYAIAVLECKIPETQIDVTEKEIVCGNDVIGRINHKTSVGYGLTGEKKDYLNYEDGIILPHTKALVKDLTDDIVEGNFKFDTYFQGAYKSELKDRVNLDVNQPPKPVRIFTAGPLLLTLLFRFFFLNMMVDCMQDKFQNGIAVGINPLSKAWNKLVTILHRISAQFIFSGDYKFYDKRMISAFQRYLNKFFMKRIKINYKQYNKIFGTNYTNDQIDLIFEQLLEIIISTPIVILNWLVITTHGLASGIAITSFYNSCINIMYNAYVFYILAKLKNIPINVASFVNNVKIFVYGDDLLGAVSPEYAEWYNPINYQKIMKTLGLDFTPADKGEWTEYNTFGPIANHTFLKRGFYNHPRINQLVGPLCEISMNSTLNYVSDSMRDVELTNIKLLNYQRESFLHYENYAENMKYVKEFANERDLYPTFLSEKELIRMYKDDEYADLLELH